MVELVWAIPALPLFGFLVLVVAGRRLGEPLAGWFATVMCGGSFVATAIVFVGLQSEPEGERRFQQVLFDWLPVGDLHVPMGLLVDPLAVTMALFVTGVSTLIHLYSIGYMHGDPQLARFFTYLNLFVFSMLMLVLGNNLLVTFLGWEGVGACSYLLVSFWFTKDANAAAGKKAFVTNRIGDWGFMVAMFLSFSAAGTLTYFSDGTRGGLLDNAATLAPVTATAIAALLFVGAVGKSAQIPLFVWLPDAMAGPTPVSALIHAATMVTSGVYLMTRVNPLLADGLAYSWLPTVIAVVGGVTALFAATVAVAQTDIKKVLAYSTVSQLGYMFLAVGSGAYVAAIFHMVTHAFFKALLFLGAGSVIHGLHDEQDMRRMGRLWRLMPITAATFIVGWLAIAGIPPFSGFWSKDEILLNAWEKSPALWALGFVTAILTAFYMARQVFLVFFGDARWKAGDGDNADAAASPANGRAPHESPWTMWLPLLALAGLAAVGGAINLPFDLPLFDGSGHVLGQWLHPVVGANERVVEVSTSQEVVMALGTAVASVAAIAAAAYVYLSKRVALERIERKVLAHAWYFDEAVSAAVAGPGAQAYEATAAFDTKGIDGAVNGAGFLVRRSAEVLRRTQSGYVRAYAAGVTVGASLLLALFLVRSA
ncbi:MAG: NADH-quinone oxidoreductase subunit L [Acidimicrobiia bacterium]